MNNISADIEKALAVIIAFNSEKNYYELLNVILIKMMEMTSADAGTLYVLEDNLLHFRITRNITLNTFQGATDKIDLPPIKLDDKNITNVSAYSAIRNEVVCIDDVYDENSKFNFTGPRNYDKLTGYNTKSMLVFPLIAVTTLDTPEVIGVIQLINATDKATGEIISFKNACDMSILLAISNIAANTLANIMFSKEISELFDSFVRVMTTAIDERSVYNVNHTNNVARLCDMFTKYLNKNFPLSHDYYFDMRRHDQLVMAALLHDVGKIITPSSIMDKMDRLGEQLEIVRLKFEIKKCQLEKDYALKIITEDSYNKLIAEHNEALALVEAANTAGFLPDDKIESIKKIAGIKYVDKEGSIIPILTEANITSLTVKKGTLTDDERLIMQEHVAITSRLLNSMRFNKYYKDVPTWAGSHHEFLDGSGYPRGLESDDISTETRILSMIDIYDALVASDRPYKSALPAEKAHNILREMAKEGKLHQELVELFIDCCVSGK